MCALDTSSQPPPGCYCLKIATLQAPPANRCKPLQAQEYTPPAISNSPPLSLVGMMQIRVAVQQRPPVPHLQEQSRRAGSTGGAGGGAPSWRRHQGPPRPRRRQRAPRSPSGNIHHPLAAVLTHGAQRAAGKEKHPESKTEALHILGTLPPTGHTHSVVLASLSPSSCTLTNN